MKWVLVAVSVLGTGMMAASAANANSWSAWQMPGTDDGKSVIYKIDVAVTDKTSIADKGTPFEQAFHTCADSATKEVGGSSAILAQKDQAVGPFENKFQACMEAAKSDQGQSMWDLACIMHEGWRM